MSSKKRLLTRAGLKAVVVGVSLVLAGVYRSENDDVGVAYPRLRGILASCFEHLRQCMPDAAGLSNDVLIGLFTMDGCIFNM